MRKRHVVTESKEEKYYADKEEFRVYLMIQNKWYERHEAMKKFSTKPESTNWCATKRVVVNSHPLVYT